MYSVFAVDDEPIVLEGIRSKIDWESQGFTFVGEASDASVHDAHRIAAEV